jgi:hypothetical protein
MLRMYGKCRISIVDRDAVGDPRQLLIFITTPKLAPKNGGSQRNLLIGIAVSPWGLPRPLLRCKKPGQGFVTITCQSRMTSKLAHACNK